MEIDKYDEEPSAEFLEKVFTTKVDDVYGFIIQTKPFTQLVKLRPGVVLREYDAVRTSDIENYYEPLLHEVYPPGYTEYEQKEYIARASNYFKNQRRKRK